MKSLICETCFKNDIDGCDRNAKQFFKNGNMVECNAHVPIINCKLCNKYEWCKVPPQKIRSCAQYHKEVVNGY